MKLSEALCEWLDRKARGWSEKVTRDVRQMSREWLVVWGADRPVGSLGVRDSEALESKLDNGIRSGSRMNQERTYARQFLAWTRKRGWGPESDPTSTWGWRRMEVRRVYAPPTREEESRLMSVARPWLRKFIALAVTTGLRVGTIQKLTWAMVRPAEGGRLVLEIPAQFMKQRKPHRIVLVGKALRELGERAVDGPLVPGMPANPSAVYKAFKSAGRRAGINLQTSPHDLKRACIQRLGESGQPLQVIMNLIGNTSESILLKHYVTDVPIKQAEAVLGQL